MWTATVNETQTETENTIKKKKKIVPATVTGIQRKTKPQIPSKSPRLHLYVAHTLLIPLSPLPSLHSSPSVPVSPFFSPLSSPHPSLLHPNLPKPILAVKELPTASNPLAVSGSHRFIYFFSHVKQVIAHVSLLGQVSACPHGLQVLRS